MRVCSIPRCFAIVLAFVGCRGDEVPPSGVSAGASDDDSGDGPPNASTTAGDDRVTTTAASSGGGEGGAEADDDDTGGVQGRPCQPASEGLCESPGEVAHCWSGPPNACGV